ncbi:MAG: protein kinase [Hyphomicrobiaceae bacterium]
MSETGRGVDVLPPGTRIDSYVIRRVLGAGGFGITYEADHERLGKTFAIKEYFPRGYAGRTGATVSALTNAEGTYQWGLDRFLQEARALARFHHRAIVSVSNVFEANGTAYIVLGFENGRDMLRWRAELGRPPTQAELDVVLTDILDALEVLHRTGLLHRDIAPDNIYIRMDGTPVLLDFGAARHAIGQRSTQMSAIVKSGYSPPEHYTTDARNQGAWSDIYALSATIYMLITGKAPPEAALRMLDDTYVPATRAIGGDYRPTFLAAIDAALRPSPGQRPQSIEAWRRSLLGGEETREIVSGPGARGPTAVPAPGATIATGPGNAREGAGAGWTAIGNAGQPQPLVSPPPAAPARKKSAMIVAAAALLLVAGMAAVALMRPAGSTVAAACDRLASIPFDPKAKGPGVSLENVDHAEAIGACRAALERAGDRDRPRIQTQLAYAYRAAGDFKSAQPLLVAASHAAYPEAQAQYGELLYDGIAPVQFDRAAACRLFDQARRGGSLTGLTSYAGCLGEGQGGLARDEARSHALYRQAADRGMREGMLYTGLQLRDGRGAAQDIPAALRWIEEAAARNEARADYLLADTYQYGYGVNTDRARARDYFAKAKSGLERMANAFHSDAMTILGVMHRDGLGTPKDVPRAIDYYRRAAALGATGAMRDLAVLLGAGEGVAKDAGRARELLQTAIAHGDESSQHLFGFWYEVGFVVQQNYTEALRNYRAAAERLYGPSMQEIGNLYYDGKGVTKNQAEALRWFRLGAERNNAPSINSVGVLIDNGDSVPSNPLEASRWYLRAANLGNADAMRNLALLHLQGRGVAKNCAEARSWYRRAADNGNADARKQLQSADLANCK